MSKPLILEMLEVLKTEFGGEYEVKLLTESSIGMQQKGLPKFSFGYPTISITNLGVDSSSITPVIRKNRIHE